MTFTKVNYLPRKRTVSDWMGILVRVLAVQGIELEVKKRHWLTTARLLLTRSVMLTVPVLYFVFAAFVIYMNGSQKHHTLISLCIWMPVSIISLTILCLYLLCLKRANNIRRFYQQLVTCLEDNNDLIQKTATLARLQKLSKICLTVGLGFIGLQFTFFKYNVKNGAFGMVIITNLSQTQHDEILWKIYSSLVENDVAVMIAFYGFIYSFMWWYTGLFCVTCKTLTVLFDNLSRDSHRGNITEYQKKHELLCGLVNDADDIFGPFLFIGLIKEFLTMVLYFKVLCNFYFSLMDSLMAGYVVALSLVSLIFKVVEAAKVNDKVYETLSGARNVHIDYYSGNQSNTEQIRHLLFVEYTMNIFNSDVGLTAWKILKVQRSLIFTTVGTVLTYVIVLREIDQDSITGI